MAEISVVTAVRTGEHLERTLRSLELQTDVEWEWVVVPTTSTAVPERLLDDERVRAVILEEPIADVNLARATGVGAATGLFVVQLDDGDELAPGALGAILGVLRRDDTEVVYGDFAMFPIHGQPVPGYNPEYGWTTGSVEIDGEALRTVTSFDPTPSSIGQASYAPRHGLAMERATYIEIGGHDPALGAASNFALVCTAYSAGKRFTRIPQVLVHTRQDQLAVRDDYLEGAIASTWTMDILRSWSTRNGLAMLDLGAAHNPTPGFVSVDLQDAAINCDIRFGIPLPDSSVGVIRASDFLEHINTCPDSACQHGADGVSPRCVVGVMNEFHRLLAPGGWLLTHTPSTDGRGAFQDPTHVSYWNPNSFWYYTRAEQARFLRGVTCRFQVARMWQGYPSEWHRSNALLYVDADLVALKGQRQPGICEI